MGPEAPTRTVVRGLLCPSDGLGGEHSTYTPGGLELGTWNHSNYLAFFGDRNLGAGLPQAVLPNRRAAFGRNTSANLTEITNGNGTSNPAAASQVRRAFLTVDPRLVSGEW